MTYEDRLLELARNNPQIVVMTAENRAPIRNVPSQLNDRFIDTGIAEQTMVGMAAGLALRGRIPVIHALASFLTLRAFEFIRTDVGIAGLPVKLVGYVPGILSDANGPTHQAIEDIAVMRGIPSMRIFCPADMEDLVIGLPVILQDPHPWYIRYNGAPPVLEHSVAFHVGASEMAAYGTDVTILTYGALFSNAFAASQFLNREGISVRLINLRTVKPIDEQAVLSAVEETSLIVTLEDHFLTGGLYSIVAELLLRHHLSGVRVLPISFGDRWFTPGLLPDVLHHEGLTPEQIAAAVRQAFHESGKPELTPTSWGKS
jgi:transketolase